MFSCPECGGEKKSPYSQSCFDCATKRRTLPPGQAAENKRLYNRLKQRELRKNPENKKKYREYMHQYRLDRIMREGNPPPNPFETPAPRGKRKGICPQCKGPKHLDAKRCQKCAGVGRLPIDNGIQLGSGVITESQIGSVKATQITEGTLVTLPKNSGKISVQISFGDRQLSFEIL